MTDRLRFRTLEEVGGEAFGEAVIRVSEGMLDREIRTERDLLGPEDAGRVHHDPSWWRLVHDGQDGPLVGLVMPANPPPSSPSSTSASSPR